MLTIQLPDEVARRLESLARATGQSPSFHAERAISECLGDLEDDAAAAREIEEVRAGRSVPVPLGEVLTSAVLGSSS